MSVTRPNASMITLLAFASLAAAPAPPAPASAPAPRRAPTPEMLFAGLTAKTCLRSHADPAKVSADAAAGRWTAIDPASVPGYPPKYFYDGKAYTRTHAWQLQLLGKTYWVTQYDIPGQPAVRECSVVTLDLDLDAVDAVFIGRPRGADDPARALPVRQYNYPDGTVMYTWSDDGERQVHVAAVTPRP